MMVDREIVPKSVKKRKGNAVNEIWFAIHPIDGAFLSLSLKQFINDLKKFETNRK